MSRPREDKVMGYIVLADARMQHISENAAIILRSRGHQVSVTSRGDEILRFLDERQPDVLVFGGTLNDMFAADILMQIPTRYPAHKTQIIWTTLRDNLTGEPMYTWESSEISAFLDFPSSEWQVVLSVEQLLYRTVLCNASAGEQGS